MEVLSDIWSSVSSIWGGGAPAHDPAADAAAAAEAKRAAELEHARDALGGKLKVVGDEEVGPRAPNQMSPEEFERAAALYADIENGHSDFRIDTAGMSKEEAAEFKKGTMGDISSIMQTESGRQLLGSLAYDENDKYDPAARKKLGDNAEGTAGHPLVHLGRSEKEHHPDCEHQQVSRDVYMDHQELGSTDENHMGATSYVEFRPGETWDGKSVELRSDVNLYHELVHALHNKMGDNAPGRAGEKAGVDAGQHMAELQAVGLGPFQTDLLNENTYRAERREMGEDVGYRETYNQ